MGSTISFKSKVSTCTTFNLQNTREEKDTYSPSNWNLVFHSIDPTTHNQRLSFEASFLPHRPVQIGQVELTRSIADVPLGLDKWMDISGNIRSMRLITSSTYLSGKRNTQAWIGTQVRATFWHFLPKFLPNESSGPALALSLKAWPHGFLAISHLVSHLNSLDSDPSVVNNWSHSWVPGWTLTNSSYIIIFAQIGTWHLHSKISAYIL